jgi:hypothetical protein
VPIIGIILRQLLIVSQDAFTLIKLLKLLLTAEQFLPVSVKLVIELDNTECPSTSLHKIHHAHTIILLNIGQEGLDGCWTSIIINLEVNALGIYIIVSLLKKARLDVNSHLAQVHSKRKFQNFALILYSKRVDVRLRFKRRIELAEIDFFVLGYVNIVEVD